MTNFGLFACRDAKIPNPSKGDDPVIAALAKNTALDIVSSLVKFYTNEI
jgi:hypothetical protein